MAERAPQIPKEKKGAQNQNSVVNPSEKPELELVNNNPEKTEGSIERNTKPKKGGRPKGSKNKPKVKKEEVDKEDANKDTGDQPDLNPYNYENELIFDPRENRDKIMNLEEKREAVEEGYRIERVDDRKRKLVKKSKPATEATKIEVSPETEKIKSEVTKATQERDSKKQEGGPTEKESSRLWPAPLGIEMGDFLVNKKGDRIVVMDIVSIDPKDSDYKKYGAGYMTLEYPDGQEENVPFSKIHDKRKNIQIEKPTGDLKTYKDNKGEYQTEEITLKVDQKTTLDKELIRAEIILEDVKNYIEKTVRKDIDVLDNYHEEKKEKLTNPKNKETAALLNEYTKMHHDFISSAEKYLNGSEGKTIDAAHRLQDLIKKFKLEKKQLANQIKSIHEQNNQSQTPKTEDYIENQEQKNSQREEKPKTRWSNFSDRILNTFRGKEKAPKKDPIEKILKKYGFKGSADIKYAVRINLAKENEYGQKTGRMAFDTYSDLNNYLLENPSSVADKDSNIYPYQILYGPEFHDWFNSLKTKKKQKIQGQIDEVFSKILKPITTQEKAPEESTSKTEIVQENPPEETTGKSSTETLEETMKRTIREYGERARKLDTENTNN